MWDESCEADFSNLSRYVPLQKQKLGNLWISMVVKTDILNIIAGTRHSVQVYRQGNLKKKDIFSKQ